MVYKYIASCISKTGKIRNDNEDNFLFNNKSLPSDNNGLNKSIYTDGTTKDAQIFAVFDGMGGEIGGELAADSGVVALREQATKLVSKAVRPKKFLSESIQIMNDWVFKNSQKSAITRSGTTTAILYFSLDQFYICNVGDSRIYRYSSSRLDMLSEDDVIYDSTIKNQHLTQFLGVDPEQYSIKPHIKKGTINNNEILLLCTDGLYNSVSNDEMCKIISEYQDNITVCVEKLADIAETHGGDDNCTIIMIQFNKKKWLAKIIERI